MRSVLVNHLAKIALLVEHPTPTTGPRSDPRLSFFRCLAACRTRSSACATLSRFCARCVLCWLAFPSAPPLAPPTPLPVARLCSSASQLLWRGQTSHDRASSATAPRLPDADQSRRVTYLLANHEISRFPFKERPHMPRSTTTPGRPGTRVSVPFRVAFHSVKSVGARDEVIFAVQ